MLVTTPVMRPGQEKLPSVNQRCRTSETLSRVLIQCQCSLTASTPTPSSGSGPMDMIMEHTLTTGRSWSSWPLMHLMLSTLCMELCLIPSTLLTSVSKLDLIIHSIIIHFTQTLHLVLLMTGTKVCWAADLLLPLSWEILEDMDSSCHLIKSYLQERRCGQLWKLLLLKFLVSNEKIIWSWILSVYLVSLVCISWLGGWRRPLCQASNELNCVGPCPWILLTQLYTNTADTECFISTEHECFY